MEGNSKGRQQTLGSRLSETEDQFAVVTVRFLLNSKGVTPFLVTPCNHLRLCQLF